MFKKLVLLLSLIAGLNSVKAEDKIILNGDVIVVQSSDTEEVEERENKDIDPLWFLILSSSVFASASLGLY